MYYTRLYIKNSSLLYWPRTLCTTFMVPSSLAFPFFTVPISFVCLIPCQAEEING